ncbi:hypothetical protein ISN45_At02g006830, partial [Arabidopsis thaliana x Arabidopsis arenosa]
VRKMRGRGDEGQYVAEEKRSSPPQRKGIKRWRFPL